MIPSLFCVVCFGTWCMHCRIHSCCLNGWQLQVWMIRIHKSATKERDHRSNLINYVLWKTFTFGDPADGYLRKRLQLRHLQNPAQLSLLHRRKFRPVSITKERRAIFDFLWVGFSLLQRDKDDHPSEWVLLWKRKRGKDHPCVVFTPFPFASWRKQKGKRSTDVHARSNSSLWVQSQINKAAQTRVGLRKV